MTKRVKQKGVRCPKRGRSRTTNRPTAARRPGSDRARHRRVNDLFRAYMRKLPDDDVSAREVAWRAAQLTALAEALRSQIMTGKMETVAEELVRVELVRTENLAARARREVARLEDPYKGELTAAEAFAQCAVPNDDEEVES
jgi:hypothetical protein